MNLKEIGKALTSKSVGTGPSSYEKRIYRAAVSQRLRNTVKENIASLHYVPVRRECFGETIVVHGENHTEGNILFGQNAATFHVSGVTRTVTIVLTFKLIFFSRQA